ncbi:response regulator transcription factor [Thalassomonas actiniarum]|uniref:Response regulator transcription factor n=1 Tax=Thalassomonas actiniarum TaxID=485447 RepID=A0AAF0BXW3_9GAMM|nr:response regulator transcription factor [Thalassomonas actiniarum]WDD97251.1 response regulator transcription factor [Thalassomonas actiniarum]
MSATTQGLAAPPARLLIVEDDQRIAKLLIQFLRSEHFDVHWLQNGEEAVAYIQQTPPDLVILDLMLPKMDGVEVCSAVRPDFDKGILMLTAHEGDIIEVTALNAGVDDFLCKPVRTHVLLARLNALFRRQNKPQQSLVEVQDLVINHDKRTLCRDNTNIPLAEAEFELLWQLATQAGSIVKRDDLFHLLRGKEYDGLDRSIDMRISKLRKKLSKGNPNKDYIRTIRQLGYILVKD